MVDIESSRSPANTNIIRGACPHDCPDRCVWQVTVEDGVAVNMAGDPDQPFTRGVLCAKVDHYLDKVYSPDRVLYPLRRVGPKGEGRFERVSWDEALAEVAARLRRTIEEDGPTAVMPYSYAGNQGLLQRNAGQRFFARIGATRLERNICGSAGSAGIRATMGTNLGMLPEDIAHSRFIILWGTNTLVTNLHLWPFIRQAREGGAAVVVVDPLKTRTARAADWHVQPMPGTDTALALGMMHVIINEGLHDADYVDSYTLGFDRLRERAAQYPPERAAQLTGLGAGEIVSLARSYATTQPASIRALIGLEHHSNGGMMYRAISCLPSLVGAWRYRGGGLVHTTTGYHTQALNVDAIDLPELEDPAIRSVNMVQLGRALTDPAMSPPIRALIVYNSNPATIAPDQNRVLEGLGRDDLFTVVLENFVTDTARYADYVFPATTQIEHLDILSSWGHTYLTLNKPAISPVGEAVQNTEFFRRLSKHMGLDEGYLYQSDEEIIRAALASDHPYLKGISFEGLMEEGWAPLGLPEDWRPFAQGDFPTPSGKCEFYAEGLLSQGMDPLPGYTPPPESPAGDPELASSYPLSMITAKSALHFLNSSYANLPRHLKAEGEPMLEMHPQDGASRGIADGDRARVFNDRGSVDLRVRLRDRVRPGVVSMPAGWWASFSPGGKSANALTGDGISDLGGGGDFYDTLVQVEKE